MLQGTVYGRHALVNLPLLTLNGNLLEIECVVDTGFAGFLTLPVAAIEALQLPFFYDVGSRLADDTEIRTSVYLATVLWAGNERIVEVIAIGKQPLVGAAMMEEHRLEIDFTEGGLVSIGGL